MNTFHFLQAIIAIVEPNKFFLGKHHPIHEQSSPSSNCSVLYISGQRNVLDCECIAQELFGIDSSRLFPLNLSSHWYRTLSANTSRSCGFSLRCPWMNEGELEYSAVLDCSNVLQWMDGRQLFRIWTITNAPREDWNNAKVPSKLIQKSLRPVIDKHCASFESGLVAIVLKIVFDKYRDDLDHRFRNYWWLNKLSWFTPEKVIGDDFSESSQNWPTRHLNLSVWCLAYRVLRVWHVCLVRSEKAIRVIVGLFVDRISSENRKPIKGGRGSDNMCTDPDNNKLFSPKLILPSDMGVGFSTRKDIGHVFVCLEFGLTISNDSHKLSVFLGFSFIRRSFSVNVHRPRYMIVIEWRSI
jgi:hypothetical protein